MNADSVTYLDSSAIVKLVVQEPESAALSRFLRRRRPLVSSALARVEVERACLSLGNIFHARARVVLERIELVRINERVLGIAGTLLPASVRSLDAIHLGTASLFGSTLGTLVTYDGRMRDAALGLGWRVSTPA
jgi:uncharacterized protein